MIVELLTIGLLLCIFVVVPIVLGSMVIRRLNESDKRANSRNRELIDIQRMDQENRNLELQIRKAEVDLVRERLERGIYDD
jgi:hypothetical protein